MADDKRNPIWDRIEPGALRVHGHEVWAPDEHSIELSQAISLKRIADSAEKIEQHLGRLRQHREEFST